MGRQQSLVPDFPDMSSRPGQARSCPRHQPPQDAEHRQEIYGCHPTCQKEAFFSQDVDLVGPMIQQDAERIPKLRQQIKALEQHMAHVAESSTIASRLATIPGFDKVCTAELASEIGMIERSRKEASLALYLGMATLDHSSGKSRGSMWPNHVNLRAKATMMIANGEFQTNVDLIKGKVSMSKVSDRSFLLERSVSASQRSEGPLSVACDGVEDIICWLRGLVGCP